MSSEKRVVKHNYDKQKSQKKDCCDCSYTAYIKECLFYSHLLCLSQSGFRASGFQQIKQTLAPGSVHR